MELYSKIDERSARKCLKKLVYLMIKIRWLKIDFIHLLKKFIIWMILV